jgi:hypothetical protein
VRSRRNGLNDVASQALSSATWSEAGA